MFFLTKTNGVLFSYLPNDCIYGTRINIGNIELKSCNFKGFNFNDFQFFKL